MPPGRATSAHQQWEVRSPDAAARASVVQVRDNAGLPVLFLDIDGPLLPFGGDPRPRPATPDPEWHFARLKRDAGRRLAGLPCVLVWATAWAEEANTEVAPRLGLPALPRVAWTIRGEEDQRRIDQGVGLHWKTRTLVTWAAGRPFVWIDDELTDTDREWVGEHHGDHALLHHVEADRGLDDADLDVVADWLRAVGSSR